MDAGWRSWVGEDRWIVRVRGELDMDTGPRFREFLAGELARQPLPCVLDLTKVTFIDSSGLHALVASLRRAHLLNRSFTLVLDPQGKVQRLLDMTGLTTLFDIRPSAAVSSLPPATLSIPSSGSLGHSGLTAPLAELLISSNAATSSH